MKHDAYATLQAHRDLEEIRRSLPKTPIKEMDVHSEEFLALFHDVLEKFVNDFDDMAQMTAIKQAGELFKTINE